MRSRSRLLARAAALVLAAGGLLAIPASPAAAADCSETPNTNQYNNGGIRFIPGVDVRHGSNEACPIVINNFEDAEPNIFCAQQIGGTENDWLYFNNTHANPPFDKHGWVREAQADVFNGDRWVAKCFTSGLVHITQHPLS
jgi:hypothetical protein